MGSILVGTASWADKSLAASGLFYPPEVKTPQAMLHFYAARFPLVEVDSTYYGMPTVRNSMIWVERTPASFAFDIKAFRLFTQHQTSPTVLPKDIRQALGPQAAAQIHYRDVPQELRDELWLRFAMALEPLNRAGKLGVVLFQFPPWFVPSNAGFAHIEECREKLPGLRLAVEFRNRTWFEGDRPERIWAFERQHGLIHVAVDEPQGFSSSIPALWEATNPEIAVVRLHGRNRDTWEAKGLKSSGERFNYLYGTEELAGIAADIRELSRRTGTVHVLCNNNYADYAQRNALDLMRLLG